MGVTSCLVKQKTDGEVARHLRRAPRERDLVSWEKVNSLLCLDRIHGSDVIAGNVSSSTCSEGTSLPPVALPGENQEREREGERTGRLE